jgi:hypothetical protein
MTKCIADLSLLNLLMGVLEKERYFPLRIERKLTEAFYRDAAYKRLQEFMLRFQTWYKELADNQRAFAPLNITTSDQSLTAWVKGNELAANDDSFYLLEMIKASNRAPKEENHNNRLRHLLNFAHQAIDHFTQNVVQK